MKKLRIVHDFWLVTLGCRMRYPVVRQTRVRKTLEFTWEFTVRKHHTKFDLCDSIQYLLLCKNSRLNLAFCWACWNGNRGQKLPSKHGRLGPRVSARFLIFLSAWVSGSISSSVNRVFAILLRTCQFYFCSRHRTHQMKLHNAFIWLRVTTYSSLHHNCGFNWVFILSLQVDIHQEHKRFDLEKKKQSHRSWFEWLTYSSSPSEFRQRIENVKRMTIVSETTSQLIRSLGADALINRWILITKTRKTDSLS